MSEISRPRHVAEALEDLAAHTGTDPGDALGARLDALAALGRAPAPAPTGDLAVLLAGAVPLAPARRRHRAALTTGAVVLALAAGTGAAAADVLPDPVQRAVATFSEHFLPFDLPRPATPPRAPALPPPAPATEAPGHGPVLPPGVHPSTPGVPTGPLPGRRSDKAPTTVPTPGAHGRSSARPTPSARPVEPTHPAKPVRPSVPAPTARPVPPASPAGQAHGSSTHEPRTTSPTDGTTDGTTEGNRATGTVPRAEASLRRSAQSTAGDGLASTAGDG